MSRKPQLRQTLSSVFLSCDFPSCLFLRFYTREYVNAIPEPGNCISIIGSCFFYWIQFFFIEISAIA